MKNSKPFVLIFFLIFLTIPLRSQELRIFGSGQFDGGSIFSTNIKGHDLEIIKSFLPKNGSNPYLSPLIDVNGELWGTTYSGGLYGYGTIFKITQNGYEKIHDFEGHDGAPLASLVQVENTLWGTTYGADGGNGTIYKIDTDGNNFYTAYYFSSSSGKNPYTNLIFNEGLLFGATRFGGSINSGGTLFSFNIENWQHTVLHNFGFDLEEGAYPTGNLILEDKTIWGTTDQGGEYYNGSIYSFDLESNSITTLHIFEEGLAPSINKNGNMITGLSEGGGRLSQGFLFTYDVSTAQYNKIFDFDGSNGANPNRGLIKRNGKFIGTTRRGGNNSSGTIFEVNVDGSGFKKIHDFTFLSGSSPSGDLLLKDGKLIGVTQNGGRDNFGAIYSLDINNNFGVIHEFKQGNTFGNTPLGTFLQIGRTLYGMNCYGGENGFGTIFSFDLDGSSLQTLHSFDQAQGKFPFGSELLHHDGKIYGTTGGGGIYDNGVIFHIKPDGTEYTKIHDFDDQNGNNPKGNLLIVEDKLYGTTTNGGSTNIGVIYSVNLDGSSFKTLIDFNVDNGALPFANGLTFFDNKIWGSTRDGGENNGGVIFNMDLDGSNFNIVFQFDVFTSGQRPRGNFIAHNSKLYGMYSSGPYIENIFDNGGIFSIDKNGNFENLHTFNSEYDQLESSRPASSPYGGLILHENVFYGTTVIGGFHNRGTIFKINPDGSEYSIITEFDRKNGGNPQYGKLVIADIEYVPLSTPEIKPIGVYPTIVSNEFKLQLFEKNLVKKVLVFDLNGGLSKSFTNIKNEVYEIGELPSGNYIIKVEFQNNTNASGRIIKR